jgi:fibronectin type 3 domain-containing protein
MTGTSGAIEVWLDGARVDELALTTNLGTAPIGRIQLGDNAGGSYDVALDDVELDTQFITDGAPSPDTTAPSAPTGLAASATSSNRVDLSWTASTDDVGVSGYDIYRNNNLLTSVGAETSYSDLAVAADTSYSYHVRARDAAGNVSVPSNTASATTPAPPTSGTFTFNAAADSYVDSALPTTNFGSGTALRFDASPQQVAYLRFDLSGVVGTIDRVTLRLYALTNHPKGCTVHPVADTSWTEGGLTWNNAPPRGAGVATCGALSANTWHEVNLTAAGLVTGNDALSVALVAANNTAASLSSRQGTAPPQLIVETSEAPPPDATPPTQPTGLQASAPSGCEVNLSWNASSDNVGVTGYGVYRGGSLVGSVDGSSTLTFQDTGVSPATQYSYQVDAVDAAGLRSVKSSSATVTTASAACSISLLPTDDSWVDSSLPTANNGTSTQLRVDGSPTVVSYLKFDVPTGGTTSHTTLRIFVNSNHSVGFDVRSVADTSWTEGTLTYANAPAFGSVAASSGSLSAGSWVEIDVTSLVSAAGPRSFALTTTSSTAMSLASRQSGDNAPQLIIESN